MANEKIIIEISPKGAVKIDVEGGSGKSCTNVTAFLETALGTSKNTEYKQDFYKQDQHIRASNG
jgi:hypothetical protein